MNLAAFYAPRGLSPAYVFGASPAEQAFLQAAREIYYKQTYTLTHNAVIAALSPDAAKEADKLYG